MGDKWKEYRISEIGRVITGKTPPTAESENYGGILPFITPSDMKGQKYIDVTERTVSIKGIKYVKTLLIPPKTVFVSCIGSDMGKVGMTKVESVTNQQINSIVVNEGIEPDYVYYNLYSRKDELQRLATSGSAQPILNKGHFSQLKILVPPLPEQKAIASILGALDDKIELNRKMNETLEAMARAIFKSWFVDFDPIPGIGPHKEWQDSPLGKIPKGWRVGTLGELVDFINERVEVTPEKDNEKYIALDDMPLRSIDLAQYRAGVEVNSSIIRFREGDVLFGAMRPYFHKVGLAQFDGITRTTTFVLRPKKSNACLFALMNFFSDTVIEYATSVSVGSTIPYIKWDALSIFQIILPTEDLIKKYNDFTTPMIHQIKMNSKQSRTLASIRDALLPKLLSGEIKVKDAERFVEASA